MAVNKQQDPAVPVSQTPETSHADVTEIAVGRDVEAAYALENIGQRAVAVFLNLLGRDDRHSRGASFRFCACLDAAYTSTLRTSSMLICVRSRCCGAGSCARHGPAARKVNPDKNPTQRRTARLL